MLQVEVLSVAGVGGSDSSLEEMGRALLRRGAPQQYQVEVSHGAVSSRSRPISAAEEDAPGIALKLSLKGVASLRDLEVKLSVHRLLEGWGGTAPRALLGEAGVSVGEESLGAPNVRTVWLAGAAGASKHRQRGRVTVRVGVIAPEVAYHVLAASPNRCLAQVLRALSQVLVQCDGAASFAQARPPDLGAPRGGDEEALRQSLQTWVIHVHSCARRLQNQENDRTTAFLFAPVMRKLQEIVQSCADGELPAEDVDRIAAGWLSNYIDCCTRGSAGTLVRARLEQLARTGSLHGEETSQCLSKYGVRLPWGTAKGVEAAVVARLVEAEQSGEVEMFSGELIVHDGRVIPGLAAVLRPGRVDDGPHLFLYSLTSIRKWQAEHGTDPSTREALCSSSILPLTGQSPVAFMHDVYARRVAPSSCFRQAARLFNTCAALRCPPRR